MSNKQVARVRGDAHLGSDDVSYDHVGSSKKTGCHSMPTYLPKQDEQIYSLAVGEFESSENSKRDFFDCSKITMDVIHLEEAPASILEVQHLDSVNSLEELSAKVKIVIFSKEAAQFRVIHLDRGHIREALLNSQALVLLGQTFYYRKCKQPLSAEYIALLKHEFGQDIECMAVSEDEWRAMCAAVEHAVQRCELPEEKKGVVETARNEDVFFNIWHDRDDIQSKGKNDLKSGAYSILLYVLKKFAVTVFSGADEEVKQRRRKQEAAANELARDIERSEIRKQERKAEIRREEIQKSEQIKTCMASN